MPPASLSRTRRLKGCSTRCSSGCAGRQPFDRGSGPVRRGRGIAIAIKAVTSPTTSVAIVNVSADGSVTLYCGSVDMGQGSDTAMAQMVGEVLDVPAEAVRVIPRDTDATPYDMGTLGSRSTVPHGARGAARGDGGQGKTESAGT